MNLTEAIKAVKADTSKGFKRPSWDSLVIYNEEEKSIEWQSSGESVDMTLNRVQATDYVVEAIDSEDDDTLHAYYDSTKGRYVSTTNVAKHKAAGRRVARFTLDEHV